MISSTALYGCTVSLLTAYGIKRWWWDTKDHPWYNNLSDGVNSDFTTLWNCLIGKRTAVEIEKEKLKMPKKTSLSAFRSEGVSDSKFLNGQHNHLLTGGLVNDNLNKSLEVDRIVAEGLEGWGETAKELSREELKDNSSNVKETSSGNKDTITNNNNDILAVPLSLNEETVESIKKSLNESDLAKITMEHLEGWGENAAEFAKEEYEELKNNKDK